MRLRRLLPPLATAAVLAAVTAVPGAVATGSDAAGSARSNDADVSSKRAVAHDSRRSPSRRVRKRKRSQRRASGHIPAWVLAAGAFTTPAPGTPPAPGAPGAPGTPPPAPTPPGTTPPSPPPPPPTCGRAVGAREGEWFVTLSRTTACSGQITVEAQNYGTDPHDLRLQREGGPEVESWPELGPGSPGGVLAKKVTLTPGRYTLYCTLVGGTPPGTPGESHAAAGMTATLTIVTP